MFNRAYYLSGAYGLWRPVLIVGMGAIGAFCPGGRQPACVSKTKNHSKIHCWQVPCSFVGAEMCPDKKRPAENTCRIVKGLDAVWAHFCLSKPCLPLLIDGTVLRAAFHDAAYRKDLLSQMDARVSSGHMEYSAGCYSGHHAGHAGACRHMDVRDEPEQYQQCYRDLVYRGRGL